MQLDIYPDQIVRAAERTKIGAREMWVATIAVSLARHGTNRWDGGDVEIAEACIKAFIGSAIRANNERTGTTIYERHPQTRAQRDTAQSSEGESNV